MVLAVMVSLAANTRLAFITAANVFIELGLYSLQVVGSIPFKLSNLCLLHSDLFSLSKRDKTLSFITRFLEAGESWRELFPADLAFLGHIICSPQLIGIPAPSDDVLPCPGIRCAA
jgi:hypothetical protein